MLRGTVGTKALKASPTRILSHKGQLNGQVGARGALSTKGPQGFLFGEFLEPLKYLPFVFLSVLAIGAFSALVERVHLSICLSILEGP